MINAYAYLQAMTLRNALVQRLRRLRQPKYLFGAIVGGAYFYFFFFRRLSGPGKPGVSVQSFHLPPELTPYLVAIAAAVLLIVVVLAWIVPSARAALQFTEAEVAFLFPAPVTRRMLVHCKLIRSQLAILVTSFFMTLILRRGSIFPGDNQWLHAAGWWLMLSTLNLHFVGASFARERLLDVGINPGRRRALIGVVVAAFVAGSWWWLRQRLALPAQGDLNGPTALLHYAAGVLGAAPIAWLLWPFKLVVAPLFAGDAGAFLRAAGPAIVVLVAHYFWVIRSDVAFEEASIDVARRNAERAAARRAGNLRMRAAPTKPRSAPFVLGAQGFAPIAFLWKSLIALGPVYRLRTWLIACAVVIIGSSWIAADPQRLPLLKIVGGIALGFGGWLIVIGPMFMRRGLSQTLAHLDVLKACPLPGWQIVLGELLSPMTIMTFAQWWILLIVAMTFGRGGGDWWLTAGDIGLAAVGVALIAPLLCGLMLCVPYAGMLVFPAWAEAAGSQGGGIEVMGQRMIFFGAYLMALTLALLPAVLLGAIAFLIGQWLSGLSLALALTALAGGVTLCAELAAAISWLGDRVEKFDLSQEMPR